MRKAGHVARTKLGKKYSVKGKYFKRGKYGNIKTPNAHLKTIKPYALKSTVDLKSIRNPHCDGGLLQNWDEND